MSITVHVFILVYPSFFKFNLILIFLFFYLYNPEIF